MKTPELVGYVVGRVRAFAHRIRLWLDARRRSIETWVLVMLLVFSVAQSAYFNSREREQVERNSLENDCQTTWATALTETLRSRDVPAVLAREAIREWVKSDRKVWRTFADLLENPLPGDQGRQQFLAALAKHDADSGHYLTTLKNVSKTAAVNDYPDLEKCFKQIDAKLAQALAFELTSGAFDRHRGMCRGRPVTIQGTKHGDIITGTNKADVIRAGKGVDLVSAGAGKDRICGGNGSDVINAGRGYDRVNCGRGLDTAQQEERRRNCEF